MVISNHLVGATAKEKHGGGKDGDKRCESKEEVVAMDVPVDTQDTKRRLVSARALHRALGCPLHTAGVDSRQLFGQSKRTIGHDVQPAAFISFLCRSVCRALSAPRATSAVSAGGWSRRSSSSPPTSGCRHMRGGAVCGTCPRLRVRGGVAALIRLDCA